MAVRDDIGKKLSKSVPRCQKCKMTPHEWHWDMDWVCANNALAYTIDSVLPRKKNQSCQNFGNVLF